MKTRIGSTMLCALAGLAASAAPAVAQSITPPDVQVLASSWAYPVPHEQHLSGSFDVTRFRLVATGGQCNTLGGGSAYQNDMLMELTAPNGTTLLVGGDFGKPYPGSIRWTDLSLAPLGTLPPSTASPAQIDVYLSHNFGPVEGTWRVNFRNHWGTGDIPWNNIEITPCPPGVCDEPGACCLPNGSCQMMFGPQCTTATGTFQGAGTFCGQCPALPGVFNEQGNAGDLPATANIATNPAGTNEPLLYIIGTAPGDDVDMFMIDICDPANFSASTVDGTTWDTILSLFDENGFGISYNDDEVGGTTTRSLITSQFIPGPGLYFIAVSQYPRHPVSQSGRIWLETPWRAERMPDGPGALDPINGWDGTPFGAGGEYTIAFTGACFVSTVVPCYANCDGSTNEPILTVDDFTCFINEFAQAQSLPHEQQVTHYANCDGSTTMPALTVDDFTCYINEFAQGCN